MLVVGMVLGTAGCGSDLSIAPEPYRGPTLEQGTLDTAYLVIADTPGSGWAVEIDATRRSVDGTDVFMTLRRPNPVAVYPNEPVEQRVLTRARTGRPLQIFARVLDYGSTEDRPYRRVRPERRR